MNTYKYEAMDSQGKELRSIIDADSPEEAASKIRDLNYFPIRIKPPVKKSIVNVPIETIPKKNYYFHYHDVIALTVCAFLAGFICCYFIGRIING